MKRSRLISAIALVAALGACNSVATRNAPLEQIPQSTMPGLTTGIKSSQSLAWHVKDVRVNVPESLTVSEANLFLPGSDIVWREDPYGDRRRQVSDILDLAISQATLGMNGGEPVYIDINVKRFHALSQKARATIGGQHTIIFEVCIRDAATETELIEPFPVEIKLKALGGQKAIDAEMRGETQKVRITREVTSVMRRYLGM
ncbi:MAG: hypothetical protein KDK00_11640 [Rhodobacteraceae bacterium]|nr:hypothetical protein [Paracoccaceae bacterium]